MPALLSLFGSSKRTDSEKARLEAFLSAFPGEYCGWASDGGVAYSSGFCEILGLERLKNLTDIQGCLSASDSAALEGLMDRLHKDGTSFTMVAHSHSGSRYYKISGSRGMAIDGGDYCHVLWLEDITKEQEAASAHTKNIEEKNKEIERLKAQLNTIPRPLWLRDDKQKLIWVNKTYCEFINADYSDVISQQKELSENKRSGKKDDKSDKGNTGTALAAKAMKTGAVQSAQTHIIVGGKRLLISVNELPMPNYNMTLGVSYNITREEELSNELKRYEASNNELLEHLQSAIAIYSADQKIEFYNSAFSQLWKLEAGWLNRKPPLGDIMEKLRETRRLPEQADFQRFKKSWLEMFTRLVEPHEDLMHLPDGTMLRMLVIPHSMGGLMMIFEDITSSLELESSYNTLIAVQKETLDNLGEAVVVYGSDGRLKLCNPAFTYLWDLHPEDIEGQPHITSIIEKRKRFFPEEEWPEKRESFLALGLDRRQRGGRIRLSLETLLDFSTVPLPDGGVLITYSDVTDTVRVETALREKNAALETAEKLKMDFLANVSYQLRTPLNAIMGFTEILDQEFFGKLNERQKEYTHDITEASTRLLDLINDILDLSTIEAGYLKLSREDVKLRPMLENLQDLVSEWARKERIEIKLKCAKNIGSISADPLRLQQALINVIRNAITYTPSDGSITLGARRSKEHIEIYVSDTGIGISKEDKSRIFEPFERAGGLKQHTHHARAGAGLGLSLVKNIVALHDGKIDLESEPGTGTTVTMTLPLTSIKTPLKIPAKKK